MQRNACSSISSNVSVMASTSEMKIDPLSEFLASTKDNIAPLSKSVLLRIFFCLNVFRI